MAAPINLVSHSTPSLTIPYLQKNFVGFKEALAFKESQGKYRVVNTLGYLGKYQILPLGNYAPTLAISFSNSDSI